MSTILRLLSDDRVTWYLPEDTSRKRRTEKLVKAPAGSITVLLTDQQGKPIDHSRAAAKLEVLPASLQVSEMQTILRELGLLALSTSTFLQVGLHGDVGDSLGKRGLGGAGQGVSLYIQSANAVVRLAKACEINWLIICQRPLTSIKTKVAVNRDQHRIASSQALLKARLKPTNSARLGLTRVSTANCNENQFLCYILERYLIVLADGFASLLESLTLQQVAILDEVPRELTDFAKQVKEKLETANLLNSAQEAEARAMAARLRRCIGWAKEARNAPFLEGVATPACAPEPSQRLLGSPGYAHILREFHANCQGSLKSIQQVLTLFTDIWQDRVKATWELYELWCLAKLYHAFVTRLGLEPDNGKHLFEEVTIRRGELQVPRNRKFALKGTILNGPSIEIGLHYEKELRNEDTDFPRKPDVFVEASIDSKQPLKFAFDAKYRDYAAQGVDAIIADVEECARDKYLKPFHLTGSFILHSDRRLDYWGEVPLRQKLHETYKTKIGEDAWRGHQLGAIALRPGHNPDRQLSKILSLILQYHGDLTDVCISCGRKLVAGKEIRLDPSDLKTEVSSESNYIERLLHSGLNKRLGIPLYCQCEQCARFWVIQHCWGRPEHLILKTAEFCLHKTSPLASNPNKWWYTCPECGGNGHPQSDDDLRAEPGYSVDPPF